MHEASLIADLIEKVETVARENGAARVVAVDILIGALDDTTVDHVREHFDMAAPGTLLEGAELRLKIDEDPLSRGLLLQSVELER